MIAIGFLAPVQSSNTKTYDADGYIEKLEEKIRLMCISVAGIDEAKVLLTLDNSIEYVYAENTVSEQQSVYLVVKSGADEQTVTVTEIFPKIRGVAVVCTGGDNAAVKEKLTRLISAAFGLSFSRIEIAGTD